MTPRVVLVTSTSVVAEVELCCRLNVAAALNEAARSRLAVQLRSPELPSRALFELGVRLRHVTRCLGARLIVNDRLDLARALGADGVHLGRRSVGVADARAFVDANVWVSMSAHDLDDVRRARAEGADAVLLSPIFASPGKATPLGLELLRKARVEAGSLGLIALGGIDRQSAPQCRQAGADGVAVLRGDLSEAFASLLS